MRVKAGDPAAERLGAVCVGKYVVPMPVAFGHRERRVQGHPKNQVGKLAQPAADPAANPAPTQDHAIHIPGPAGRLANQAPITQGFARAYHHPI
ncbi:hypothetical protein SDC9_163939 [bioreactor metagenome]|uniref:Uncharacterized protein n=1 Tax=bioreactor metagenome TaxID=1076179 RepID=A0A645FXG6_9ZZZZ